MLLSKTACERFNERTVMTYYCEAQRPATTIACTIINLSRFIFQTVRIVRYNTINQSINERCDEHRLRWASMSASLYRASICEGGLGSRNSVCPSVRLSQGWTVTKLNDPLRSIFWYHTKGQSLCYSDTNRGWWATLPSLWNLRSKWPTPFEKRRLRPISAHNVSTVRDSEKSSIMTNIKSTTRFPTSYRWSAYVTPKSTKGWLKERFFVF